MPSFCLSLSNFIFILYWLNFRLIPDYYPLRLEGAVYQDSLGSESEDAFGVLLKRGFKLASDQILGELLLAGGGVAKLR